MHQFVIFIKKMIFVAKPNSGKGIFYNAFDCCIPHSLSEISGVTFTGIAMLELRPCKQALTLNKEAKFQQKIVLQKLKSYYSFLKK